MRIEHCHIENFGKLHDFEMDFTDGLTEVHCENGWGKSTLSAFIRAMLYGLEGDGKRGLSSERRRYRPWQGGDFGGWMIFHAGDRRYRVIRTFGDKAKDDAFLLYDANTGLQSRDYTGKLGEELFQINKETFERTVFIEAGDCRAVATGDVNQCIGNLTEDSKDINNYEKADAYLKDLENKLSERRKTGELYKKKAEITALNKEVADGGSLQTSIGRYENRLDEDRRKLKAWQKQEDEIAGRQEEAARRNALLVQAKEYERLCEDVRDAEAQARTAREAFPGEVPSWSEVGACLDACLSMHELDGQCRAASFSQKESDRILAYADRFQRKVPKEETIEQIRGQIEALHDLKADTDRDDPVPQTSSRVPVILLILGAAAAVMGICMLAFVNVVVGIGLLCAAVFLLVYGMIMLVRDRRAYAEELKKLARAADKKKENIKRLEKELSDFFASYGYDGEMDFSKALYMLEYDVRDYQTLAEKRRYYEKLFDQWKEVNDRIQSFIRTYAGEVRDSALIQQVREIERARDDYEDAEKALIDKRVAKEEFEKGHDVETLRNAQESDDDSIVVLQERKNELSDKIQALRDQIQESQKNADALREAYDEWSEKKESLAQKQDDYEALKQKYAYIQKTRAYLGEAKISLINRYTDPVLQSFRQYFDCFSHEIGASIRMDAELNISREEFGQPREVETQSSGLQSMMGFCLRAAYVDAMYLNRGEAAERPPLILDDPFMTLDEMNVQAARALLAQLSEKYQVIYFTCSQEREFTSVEEA